MVGVNDPSEGSPTETLLRLLLPLNGEIRTGSDVGSRSDRFRPPSGFDAVSSPHRAVRSVEATGGVYKGQGRNRGKLMTCHY